VVNEGIDLGGNHPVKDIKITTDFIRLDQVLKLSGLAPTGGQAKLLIQSGRVKVDGVVETHRGTKIRDQNVIAVNDEHVFRVVKKLDSQRRG